MLPDEVELEHHYRFECKHEWADYLKIIRKDYACPSAFYLSDDAPLVEQLNSWHRSVYGVSYPLKAQELIKKTEKKLAKPKIYEFDFTKNLDWKVGSFGDKGSCFWGGRMNHRLSLQEYGCRAVRFYKGKRGVARAWAWPYGKHGLILFNAYGFLLSEIAGVLSRFFNLEHGRVDVYNNDIHINNNLGEYVAKESLVEKTDSIELKVYLTYECIGCCQRLPTKKLKNFNIRGAICKRCASTGITRCDYCFAELTDNKITSKTAPYACKYIICPNCQECNYVCVYCEKTGSLNWLNNKLSHYKCAYGIR